MECRVGMNRVLLKQIVSCGSTRAVYKSSGFPVGPKNATNRILNYEKAMMSHSVLMAQRRYQSTDSDSFIDSSLTTLTETPFTRLSEHFLTSLHDLGPLEWSTTIFLAALAFRLTVCVPIKIYQEHQIARRVNTMPEVQATVEKVFKAKKIHPQLLSMEQRRKLELEARAIREHVYKKRDVRPQKVALASLLQFPFWIHLSSALRSLTRGANGHELESTQMTNESLLWLDSLTSIDPFYLLPVIFLTTSMANFKYASLSLKSQTLKNQTADLMFKARKGLILAVPVVMTFIIAKMPAAIALFWISSNSLHLVEQIILDFVIVRRLFRIPKTPMEPANIHLEKLKNLKEELQSLKNLFK